MTDEDMAWHRERITTLTCNLDGQPPTGEQIAQMWNDAAGRMKPNYGIVGVIIKRAKAEHLAHLMHAATVLAGRPGVISSTDPDAVAELMKDTSAVWEVTFISDIERPARGAA